MQEVIHQVGGDRQLNLTVKPKHFHPHSKRGSKEWEAYETSRFLYQECVSASALNVRCLKRALRLLSHAPSL